MQFEIKNDLKAAPTNLTDAFKLIQPAADCFLDFQTMKMADDENVRAHRTKRL